MRRIAFKTIMDRLMISTLLASPMLILCIASPAAGQGYVPQTLIKTRTFNLPQNHNWFVPMMASLDKMDIRPLIDPLPWNYQLRETYNEYVGKGLMGYTASTFSTAFGQSVVAGPAYPTTIPPATVQLIEYNNTTCNPTGRNPATPAPPTFSDAKTAADSFCKSMCGADYEMSDFEMNQWKYICYLDGYAPGGPKSYNIITWGGTRCEKTINPEQVSVCNPYTQLTQVRAKLNGPLAECPECDFDGDGLITLKDLVFSRNEVFGPKKQGLGLTFPIVHATGKMVHETMDLQNYVGTSTQTVDYVDLTGWTDGQPIDCNGNRSR